MLFLYAAQKTRTVIKVNKKTEKLLQTKGDQRNIRAMQCKILNWILLGITETTVKT